MRRLAGMRSVGVGCQSAACCILTLALPSAAGAASVEVRTNPNAGRDEVFYVAAAGERNALRIHSQIMSPGPSGRQLWTFHDSGAVVSAGESCVGVDEHTAQCSARPYPASEPTFFQSLELARVVLGDLNDELAVDLERESGVIAAEITASGGSGDDQLSVSAGRGVLSGDSGNDRLTSAHYNDLLRGGAGDDRLLSGDSSDELFGGGGVDALFGQEGDGDVLSDGDRDGVTHRAPGPDVLDGGPGLTQ